MPRKIIFVHGTDNNIKIEKLFEKEMKTMRLYFSLPFKGKVREELFNNDDESSKIMNIWKTIKILYLIY